MKKCSYVRLRPGRDAIDPRNGLLFARFDASPTLSIEVDGQTVILTAADGAESRFALSNCFGAVFAAPASEPLPVVVVPATPKPAKLKEKVSPK
jgi:hypothetical protein